MESGNVVNTQPELSGIIDETKSYIYEQLWKMCAGPLCDLPKPGEKVYYFPQGHIELVEASTKDKLNPLQLDFALPSKIQCRVMAIKLKAEKSTDQVYAEITLIPDSTQFNETPKNQTKKPVVKSFTKVLTASDTSIHGGFTVPIKHATECLPPLDMSQPIPTQELLAKDIHGNEWRFKHSFRGTPRRHLITTGWSAFVHAKKLVSDDIFVFLRGETGELLVGVRRAREQEGNIDSSLISVESMRHGIIAFAKQALAKQCMFTVIYKPSSSQFVVSYDKFLHAVNNKFNVGSRFNLRIEDEDLSERRPRYSGTIIGVNNFSSLWKDSEWRSLQVKWDEDVSFPGPNNVSPWEIEHLTSSSNLFQSSLLNNKRSKHVNEIGSTSSNPVPPPPILTEGLEIGQSSKSGAGGSCILFGVSLDTPSPTSTRTFTKVKMQGDTVGRALDISVLTGYDELISKLDNLFNLHGQLQTRNRWEILFTDNEGDLMLVGDDPWPEFCNMVQTIFICSKENIKNLKLENNLSI